MNQGRIWCVVSPTVGLPLLLGSVAVTSLIVHAAVMTHVTWMGNYWQGSAKVRTAEADGNTTTALAAAKTTAPGFTITVTPNDASADASRAAATAFVVKVAPTPSSTATAPPDPAKPAAKMALNTQ